MMEILVVGSSKFAVDVVEMMETALRHAGSEYVHRGYLWVEGDEMSTDPAVTRPFEPSALGSGKSKIVVAVSDPRLRAKLFAEHHEALRDAAINIIHPTAVLAKGCQLGVGNVIGAHCCLGMNSRLGDFNVLNYHIGLGHHSQIGDFNFMAPGFQCGNTVNIGNSNFFGLSCTVGPGIAIGNSNRFQAGSMIMQPIASNLLCFSTERLKIVPQLQEV